MSLILNYPFTTPSNYSYNTNEIELAAGSAKLKLQQADVDFIEDFADDTGFTYNSTYAEFTGGLVRQKSVLPANSICGAKYTSSLNLNWGTTGFSSLAYTANGTPVLSSGKLDCVGVNGLYYSDALIGALSGDFVAKFKYTPHYSTSPATNVNIITFSPVAGSTDRIALFNSPSGNNIRITANGLSAVTFDTWEPTAEQEYTFELICIANQISLYIDNVQLGTSKTITPGQGTSAVRVWFGAYTDLYNIANAAFDEFILYSTAAQTSTYTIPVATYLETSVILPEMQHTGDGTIKLFNSFSTTETGTPRYTLQIGQSGNYLYWNGSTWTVSDGTYEQANDSSVFNTNCGSLPVNGEEYGQFKIIFPDSNTISSVSELTANMNVDIGYLTTNPTIETVSSFRSDELVNYLETSTKTGSDEIKAVLKKNGVSYYHNGISWVTSDNTYTQSNTATEILTYISTFTTIGVNIKIKWFLHSADGTTTPYLDNIYIEYDFSGELPTLTTITYYGYLRSITQYLTNESIKVRAAWTIGDSTIITDEWETIETNSIGYWEYDLVVEDVDPVYIEWWIQDTIYRTNFINNGDGTQVKFSELTVTYIRTV